MATDFDSLVGDLERSYEELQARMADPSVYNDHREAADVGRRLKELERPYKLAQQLARMTGESMTEAVTEAVRERLKRVKDQRAAKLSDRLLEIGRDCATRLKEPFRSADHGDLLYDEKGLPK